MPPLIRHGSHYHLNGTPLELGTVVEVWFPDGVHRGHFFWSGIAGDIPFVWNQSFGCRVPPDADFRRYVAERVEYIPQPLPERVKDHDRRAPPTV